MTDMYENVAARIEGITKEVLDLRKRLADQRDSYDLAVQIRDAAREASNRDLEARREAQARVIKLERALSFAAGVIKSGESWNVICEDIIGGALK